MSVTRTCSVIGIALTLSACGSSPTGPEATLVGQWTGTTTQGLPISFVVTPSQTVTSIVAGLCTGTRTLSNVSVTILHSSLFLPSIPDVPSFDYISDAQPPDPSYIEVEGAFTSATAAHGDLFFSKTSACTDGYANWNATKQ